MKFGRYLQDNLTPEWRRAYIDYRGCKKRIKVVSQRIAANRSGTRTPAQIEAGTSGSTSASLSGITSPLPNPNALGGDGYASGSATASGQGIGGGGWPDPRSVLDQEEQREPAVAPIGVTVKKDSLRIRTDQGNGTGSGEGRGQFSGKANRQGDSEDERNAGVTPLSPSGLAIMSPMSINGSPKKPQQSTSATPMSPRSKSRWLAALSGDEDSSDDDLDHGPAAPPKRRGSSVKQRGTPSFKASSRGTPKSPQATVPGSKQINPVTTPNYGSTRLSPRPPNSAPTNPPYLDLGEPSVEHSSTTPETRARSNTVAFAASTSSTTGPESPPRVRISEGDEGIGKSPEASSRSHSGESHRSQDEDSDAGTPLTNPVSPAVKENNRDPKSAKTLASATPRSPKSPLTAFQALVRKASRAGSSPRSAHPSSSPRMGSGDGNSPRTQNAAAGSRSIRSMTLPSPFLPARTASTFEELYESLEPDEQDFFDFLDKELEKVESFYLARQADAIRRGQELQDQLRELAEHRRIYHSLYGNGGTMSVWEGKVERMIPTQLVGDAAQATVTGVANAAQRLHLRIPGRQTGAENGVNGDSNHQQANGEINGLGTADKGAGLREAMKADKEHKTYNPERYTKYKQELRKAVLEYYRHLEIIKNYRIMNVTGFRKALKKFEKATRVHCLEMYTDERISSEAFAKGETIEAWLKAAEDMFSTHFEHGDIKKARDRLRKQDSGHTHYTSVFRSGIMVGVGLPIAIVALVEAVKEETEQYIPAWEGLLQVYGGLFLPVIFALLFELNLAAYVANRINYSFVMELSRPVLDFRSYMEIPAFLFLTLSVCMFFSYNRIGADDVDPTTWPAAWLVFVAVFFLNPFPVFRRHSRYWFLRVLWRVITPGWSRVEFIAFFVADELNSLAYSVGNILFLSCAYANRWPDDIYTVCPSGSRWYYIFLFALPAAIRLIQCLKRWHDSRLRIHLINAGKYCSSILQYWFFIWWRSRGSQIPDNVFIGWVIVAVISAAYNTSWDYAVDWALFRPGFKGLRAERGYSSQYFYYFAVVTNFFIRFVWVWYIPARASHVRLRSFFFALAEVFRRWQWNFFRVETEHLGNADAYRVTREIPLPYSRLDDSDEEAERAKLNPVKARWAKVMGRLRDRNAPPDSRDGAPSTASGSREYEARQTGTGEARAEDGPGDRGWDGLVRRLKSRRQAEEGRQDEGRESPN